MAANVGVDSSLPKDDYQCLTELSNALVARYGDHTQIQKNRPRCFKITFSELAPRAICFSLLAWTTRVGGT
eukprot:scaffold12738_cov81-Cylindrotheca_fusiformis.AAC.1